MRIPFPERLPISRVAIAAVVFFAIQRIEGTSLFFATGCLVFILIAAFAFNIAGGLSRTAGAYIFFYSVLVFVIGVGYKAFLGEPAQSNLADPRTTIEVFDGGIAAMLIAAFLSRRFTRRTGLLENILDDSQMYRASVGCIVVGFGATSAIALLGQSGNRLQTAFSQLNQLIPLGIIIGVMYEIRRSGGRRSVNLPVLLGAAYFFLYYGIIGFSKQGMLTPLFCWFVTVWVMQYRLTRVQVGAGLLFVFVIFHYLVPYAQYGRSFVEEGQTLSQRWEIAVRLLEDPEHTRQSYEVNQAALHGLNNYYNTSQGFWDRLQFISVDDALIDVTDQGKVFGTAPLKAELLNAIPHVFWPDKPEVNFGNIYAHEIGGFTDEDTTTGISFSPTGEAYHIARWVGVLVIAPLLWFLLFVVFDSLFGKLSATPWGLLVLVGLGHYAPEGALTGVVRLLTFGTEIFVFCAFFAAWAAPVFATMVLGPDRRNAPAPQPLHAMPGPRSAVSR